MSYTVQCDHKTFAITYLALSLISCQIISASEIQIFLSKLCTSIWLIIDKCNCGKSQMQHNSCAHFEHFALTIPNTSHPCLYHLRVVFFVPSSTTTIMQGFSLVSACFGCVLHVPHAYLGPFCCCLAAELEFIDMDTPNIFQ